MKKAIQFLGFLIVFSCKVPREKNYSKIETSEFIKTYKDNKKNSILIDLRTESDFRRGSIDDAININFYSDNFEEQLSRLDTDKIAFIFCQTGARSGKASEVFLKFDFKKVFDLKGGYSHYR